MDFKDDFFGKSAGSLDLECRYLYNPQGFSNSIITLSTEFYDILTNGNDFNRP